MAILRNGFILLLTWALLACSSTPAPVIDRLPATKPNTASKSSTKPSTGKVTGDWRPDTYLVKKGDTLFSIGLEYGYDYKEIAQLNDIKAPYIIKIGQILKFSTLKDKPTNVENKAVQENTDGVTTYPIGTEPSAAATNTPPITPQVIALSEPKAIREPYSDDAFKKPLPVAKPENEKIISVTKPVATSTPSTNTTKPGSEIKPETKAEPKPDVKPNTETADITEWAWPTKGKVIANFNDAGNKGIDITGTMGQSINAAAAGKVIYSGSDLRGYGKLVIIKHNATYLSVYAHNNLIVVKEGQVVTRGQKIAEMGNTDSNTIKLHFEIRQQGKSVDPNKFLASN
ncbi:MAG: peptidase M23 [Methylotenera sp. RIFCSPLOWO2_02_FULL_45_14]|nr:MAG: peptidase M23 [Methylotenera sp. RIFCSPLOWO2_02_FULL_45_14]